MYELTHLSLFTGFGGLDIAAEMAGFETVGQCEWADYPTDLLEKRFPDVARWRDIHTLTKESFYEKTGRKTVTVLGGGPPCQPFSCAGQRRGKEDIRYLIPEYFRVLDEIKPTWAIFENVTGLATMAEPIEAFRVESRTINRCAEADYYNSILSRQEELLYESVLQEFEKAGYDVQPYRIPACGVGANHKRDRIVIVAYSGSNDVADAMRNRGAAGFTTATGGEKRQTTEPEYGGQVMADANGKCGKGTMRSRRRRPEPSNSCEIMGNANSWGLTGYRGGQYAFKLKNGRWWSTEPPLGRVANGVSNRVEQLKGLGNAVVPAQAYPFYKTIYDIEMILKEA